jgi:hypothetical protein
MRKFRNSWSEIIEVYHGGNVDEAFRESHAIAVWVFRPSLPL